MSKIIGMIPARMDSKRLPGKMIKKIANLPMVVHTCLRAQMSVVLDEVYLVTDNEEICKIGEKFFIKTIMTGKHENGTERLAEACKDIDCDYVVNIHGDEPLITHSQISQVINGREGNVTIAVTPYNRKGRDSDIKAVLDIHGNIMYCSRSDIPYNSNMLKMCFIVVFKKNFLLNYPSLRKTPLERIENNEYLRILESGEKIKAVHLDHCDISVDTEEDLKEVRELMEKQIRSETWL